MGKTMLMDKEKVINGLIEKYRIPPGYRIATYGDVARNQVTHATCACKRKQLVEITQDSHSCTWLKLVKEKME